jgi:hypothetical protein
MRKFLLGLIIMSLIFTTFVVVMVKKKKQVPEKKLQH